jgi:hypothetical protein
MEQSPINLFYEEPERDRWLPFDRVPRKVIRRLVRGKSRTLGHRRTFLNLCAGLDKIDQPYRVNDFRYAQRNPGETVGIVGKPYVLDKINWNNRIVFGPCTYSHPSDDPELLQRLPIKMILAYGEWMRQMCEPFWQDQVRTWAVGIDTCAWSPSARKTTDVLLYDKVMWERPHYDRELIAPILAQLKRQSLSFLTLRYGSYQEVEFRESLAKCRAMIFLCEHETQGIAYQQALSCGVPILAWDRGGYWQDPSYYPHKVKFAPVTSVPYWDARCGVKFKDIGEFPDRLAEFLARQAANDFAPRDFILENLTLEKCATRYVEFYHEAAG